MRTRGSRRRRGLWPTTSSQRLKRRMSASSRRHSALHPSRAHFSAFVSMVCWCWQVVEQVATLKWTDRVVGESA